MNMNATAMKDAVRGMLEPLAEALYPSHVACTLCNQEAVLNDASLCQTCAASLILCGTLPPPAPLDGLSAAYRYEGGVIAGIHALKYGKQTRLARFFADSMTVPPDWDFDCVAPVPLHPLKRWLRTYNQSELIAKSLARRLSLKLEPRLMKRTRFTRTQTALDEFERVKNVANAFVASPAAVGRSVLLVDDVTTTHSTLLACAVALKAAGAARVYAVCACCADRKA